MEINAYQKEDYKGVYHLLKEEGLSSFVDTHKTEYKEALENSLTYVAKEQTEIIGFIRAITDKIYSTFIGEIIIDKKYRNNHIGSKLINHIEKNNPTCKLELICDEEVFYRKNGFSTVGIGKRKSQN